jgi:hypothetical protein
MVLRPRLLRKVGKDGVSSEGHQAMMDLSVVGVVAEKSSVAAEGMVEVTSMLRTSSRY